MSSVEREPQFALALADAGEHDAIGGDAGLARTAELALADHIDAGALGCEQPQHGEPVVRLHRVVDVRVHPGRGQRVSQHAIAPSHGGRRIDPHRRADVIRDRIERHVVDHQSVHRMHGEMRPCRDQLGRGGFGRVWAKGRCHH